MKMKLMTALLLTLASVTVFPSGSTVGNGLTADKAEKVCVKEGKDIKIGASEKCPEGSTEKAVLPEKKEEPKAPEAPKK